MQWQYSLAQLTVLGCAPPEMTYIAARAGYDYVSYRLIYMGLPGEPNYALDQNKAMYLQTKRAMADTGLKLLDMELARINKGLEPKRYLPAMEIAAELGGKHVLSSVWVDDWNFAVESFGELCDLAKPFGLTVDLEYVPISGLKNLDDTVKFLKAVNRENAGLMIDTHHFHRAYDKVEALDSLPKEWFNFLHLCDACGEIPTTLEEMTRILREERLYVGEGGINVAEIIKHIPQVPCSIELPNIAKVKEFGYAEHAARCLDSAKSYFLENSLN